MSFGSGGSGSGRVTLHLRGGGPDPGTVRLDRRPYLRRCGNRWRAAPSGARQRQGRRHQGLPVKAADQLNLCGDGGALRHRSAADPTRRPRDKAKVEVAVLVVERWILARPRHRRFYSLAELNAASAELLKRLNEERPLRRIGRTRRQLLEELDRPALKPLPVDPYVFALSRVCRVGIDYHIEVDKYFYSVPYRFARAAGVKNFYS